MNLSIVDQLHFLFSGGWPAIFAIVIGLSLLLTFQSFKKFRNFFGLAYLAIPGCTLAVFGILGIVYTGFEINNSVAKINLNSQQIMKDNESDIIAKIKNGFYVDAGKILESIKVKCDLDFITLSLIPSNELVAQIGNPKSDNQIKSSKYILSSTDIDGSTVEWGRLDFQLDHESLGAKIKEIADRIAIFMINMGLGSLVSSLLLAFYFFRHLKRPSIFVNNLRKAVTESSDVESLLKKMNSLDYDKAFLEEELQLKHNLKSITIGMTELQNRWLKNESEAVLGRMASQVSHDIRSPLSALTMLINQLTDVPEDKRTLIRSSFNRINDIANTLLEKSKAHAAESKLLNSSDAVGVGIGFGASAGNFENSNIILQKKDEPFKLQIELLPALIDTIVSEKRVQFRDKINIEIESDLKNSYGSFVNINSTELKRVVSNLINNSIEAFSDAKGKIDVLIQRDQKNVTLIVQDNGNGIPEHVLTKLGQLGVTHGKEGTQSGSGLGVYHAKQTIEKCGGVFTIESTVGKGTAIKMKFPLAPAPKWFVEILVLTPGCKVVSLDDDLSIHGIWRGRLQSLNISQHQIEHLTFTSGPEFKEWHLKNKLHSNSVTSSNSSSGSSSNLNSEFEKIIYLVDFELLNQKQTGLEIIEELGIGEQSILVTSRYEENQIQSKCNQLKVCLIPKMMASLVPMEIEKPKEKIDSCLIDDDSLIRMSWEMVAKQKGHKLKTFDSFESFIESSEGISKEVPISIDMNLKNGVRGTDVAIKLHKMGYNQLFLATGYDACHLGEEVPPCILEVRGKEPVF